MGALLAALLQYGPTVLGFLPEVPNVVNAVEGVFGKTANNGQDKLQAAVALLKQLEPTLEDAFNATPVVKAVIEGIINIAVSVAQIEGTLKGTVPPTSAVAPLLSSIVSTKPAVATKASPVGPTPVSGSTDE